MTLLYSLSLLIDLHEAVWFFMLRFSPTADPGRIAVSDLGRLYTTRVKVHSRRELIGALDNLTDSVSLVQSLLNKERFGTNDIFNI